MSETERIAGLLEQIFNGPAYYGPSVLTALEGVTVEEAIQKPCGCAHSILDIAGHLTAELIYAREVIEGSAGHWDDTTTWPDMVGESEAVWEQAVEELKTANRALVRVIRELDDAILDMKPVHVMGPYYVMLHGTIQHSVFHTGEISLLLGQIRPTKRGSDALETE